MSFSRRLLFASHQPNVVSQPPATTVKVWYTTASQSSLFSPQTDISRSTYDSTPGTRPITIDSSTTYQTMIGFGAAVTDSATAVIWGMPSAARTALMAELFDPSSGRGMSVVRLPMGSSDFARFDYTYDDNGGSVDAALANFSIAPDLTNTIPLLLAAKALNPNLKIIAAPWSPPAWMKTGSNGLKGGSLNPTYYALYAQYFVKFVQAYAAQGLPVYALTVQNEPENPTASYPSMGMTAAQQATFIGSHLGPAFASAGITTKILAYDHNWDDTTYPETVMGDSTAGPYVAGVAWHAYAGSVDAQTTVHNAFPAKDTYFTEITASQPGNFGGDLQWHMRNIMLGAPNNWAKTTLHWNLALDQNNGPINGGFTTGQGVIQVDTGTAAVTRYSTYYAITHLSAKVKPGAVRVSCTTYGTGFVIATAYLNPDGSKVCVLLCDASSAQTFKIIENGQQFSVTMQPGDVATYFWAA